MAIRQSPSPRLLSTRLGPWDRGLDLKSAADAIKKGRCRDAQNVLFDEEQGAFLKRFGILALSTIPSGTPRDAYVFTRADGTSYLLVSNGSTLFYTTDPSVSAGWTTLKTGLNSDGFMEFETAENRVWMTNGIDKPMSWDGTTLVIYDRAQTVTAASTAVTTTTIQNTALTQADDYWNGQKLIFKSGAAAGTTVTVTDFDSATDTLTFTPAVSGLAVGDDFKVGLDLPLFRGWRFWDGHLWGFSTTDNPSESRFHRLTDPDTGNDITIDNPEAWPATFQLDINSDDGDRVWGCSPILRDRILFHKATGLFRVERDPLTLYRVELITRAVGSRFPRSWAEKEGLLYFVGQDKDSFPEVYKTDMVNVVLVDPSGGLEPALRALQQPNSVQKSHVISIQSEFDAGTKSTGVNTDNGKLEVPNFNTKDEWDTDFSNSNIDTALIPGSIRLPGTLTLLDDFSDLDFTASPAWTVYAGTWSAATGRLSASAGNGFISTPLTQDFESSWKFTINVDAGPVELGLLFNAGNNTGGSSPNPNGAGYALGISSSGVTATRYDPGGFGTFLTSTLISSSGDFEVLVTKTSAGVWKIYKNGTQILTFTSTTYSVGTHIWMNNRDAGNPTGNLDIIHYAPFIVENVTPTSGEIVFQFDYTRAPDSFGRFFGTQQLNGGTVSYSSWSSSSSDFSTGTDPAGFVSFANGAIPSSLIKQYLRIKIALTPGGNSGPTISSLVCGMLWLSAPIQLGQNIASFRTLIAALTTPAGTDQVIKVRRATVLTTPAEGDFGSFFTIVNGDNIGTILGDPPTPTSRWVQLKVEQGPSSAGAVPDVDALNVQWSEGSDGILPLQAVVHKKRYKFTAAQDTSTANDFIGVADRNDAWTKYSGWNLNWMGHFKGVFIGISSNSSKVFQLDVENHYDDDGAAIDAFLDTPEDDLGREEVRKDLRYGYIHPGEEAFTLSVSYKRPQDADFTGTKTISIGSTGVDARVNFGQGTIGKRFQRRYRNNSLGQPLKITGETLYYAPRGLEPL